MNLQQVVFLQDDECHWYMIPVGMSVEFVRASDKEFEEKFDCFRLDGGPEGIIVWAETEEETQ